MADKMSITGSGRPKAQALRGQALQAFQLAQPNFQMAFNTVIKNKDLDNYLGPTYADGKPFLNFKDTGARMTQWSPTSQDISTVQLQQNIPLNNTASRNGVQNAAVNLGDTQLKAWVFSTQTLANPSTRSVFCTTNADCAPMGKNYTCNSNYQPWGDARGNQTGSVCVPTVYPELVGGSYYRSQKSQGGIGKECQADSECDQKNGYECKPGNNIDPNQTQVGYCAQPYMCGTEKRYTGYPYNAGKPLEPPKDQNNGGAGYATSVECNNNMMPQQQCVKADNGQFYAVYPGFCPVQPNLRQQGPSGPLVKTSANQLQRGFAIPSYADSLGSSIGGSDLKVIRSDARWSPLEYLNSGIGSG